MLTVIHRNLNTGNIINSVKIDLKKNKERLSFCLRYRWTIPITYITNKISTPTLVWFDKDAKDRKYYFTPSIIRKFHVFFQQCKYHLII